MIQRRNIAGLFVRGLIPALAIVVALLLAGPAGAAAPPPKPLQEAPGPKPLFDDRDRPDFQTDPVRMALAVIGASTSPTTGPMGSLAVTYAGEHPRVAAWSLKNALTNRHSRISLGAATLVLSGCDNGFGSALTKLATLLVSQKLDCWSLQDTDIFRPLPRRWLRIIKDDKEILNHENDVYSAVLVRAYFTSAKAFASAVRTDITLTHLLEDPESCRGAVVHVEGKLQKINRHDPPWLAGAGPNGVVNDLYDAWISVGPALYRVVFVEWPAGLSRDLLGKEKIAEPPTVIANGYFFKLFKGFQFTINRRHVERDVPFLVTHTLEIPAPEAPVEKSDSSSVWLKKVIYGMLGLFIAVVFGVLGLTYWYRKHDNDIRKRLLKARAPEFVLPPPDATPVAPLAPPVRPAIEHTPPRFDFPSGPTHRTGDRPREQGGGSDSPDRPPDEGAGS
jgi:hypothetical protein